MIPIDTPPGAVEEGAEMNLWTEAELAAMSEQHLRDIIMGIAPNTQLAEFVLLYARSKHILINIVMNHSMENYRKEMSKKFDPPYISRKELASFN